MLYYMIPEYRDGLGSCCRVKHKNGEELRQETLQVVLRRELGERGMDLKIIRRMCSKVIMQRNLIPLYIGQEEVLMPIKVREPRVKRDGGYGYVNAFYIKKLEGSRLLLKDGTFIDFLESKRAVAKRIKVSQRLHQHMDRRPMGMTAADTPPSPQSPATKEDVAILTQEVLRLSRQITAMMEKREEA